MLFAKVTIFCRHALTIVWIIAFFDLIDVIADSRCVQLGRAKHERLLSLIDLIHELMNAALLALGNDDLGVEIGLGVFVIRIDITFHHFIRGIIHIGINSAGHLAHLEGR